MGKREAWADARLEVLARRCPEALALARLLAPAVTIDAPLLRSMRLTLLPRTGAWIEAELWHSPLVKARSAGGLRFEPAVIERLREQLAAAWQADDEGERQRILEARGVMAAVHTGLSPALALEERVAWAAAMGELDEIEEALASAVKGVLDGSRPGLAAWAGQAVARLPAESFGTSAGQALRLLAAQAGHATATRPEGVSPTRILSELPLARLGIARRGPLLVLGATAWRAGFALPVPDSEPRLVEVLWQDEDDRLLRMPHAIAGGEAQEIEVGHARVQLVNALGEAFEVPGFERWAGGGAGYGRLELHHGQREGMGEGYMLTLQRGEMDAHGTALDFIGGSVEQLAPSLLEAWASASRDADDFMLEAGLAQFRDIPLLQSHQLSMLAPDDDIELHLDSAAARIPWEYLLGKRGLNGRLVHARSGSMRRSADDASGHAVLVASVANLDRPSPADIDEIFRSARFEVEILSEASATELVTRLHRRPWRALHLESLIDPTGGKRPRDVAVSLPIGDGAFLSPGDLEQLKVLPELVVIRGGARAGAGFAASWGEALREGLVSAVLVNDWHVADEIASVFFGSFYEVLTAGGTVAEAALIARLETRRRFPGSPAWAAFQLHGDGEYRLPRVAPRKAATKAAEAKAAEPYDLRAIRALEQRGVPEPGLYAIDASAVPPSLNGPDAFSMLQGRALLFIHGMGSSMLGSFAGMWSSDNLAAWQQLASAYSGRMLCFEHWGLSRSPLENALELVRALPFGIELTVLSVSDGGLIGELLCRAGRVADQPGWEDDDFWESAGRTEETAAPFDEADFALFDGAARETLERLAKEMMSKSLRIVDFVRIACPVRGTTYPARAKQVFGGIARLMGTVGSHAGSLPLRLLDAIVDPERVPGLRAMEPTAPLIRMLNREGVRVDSELAIVAGTFRADSLAGRLKAGLLGLLVDRDNDMLVATESMFGGAARTRPARFVRFEGGDINHFSYLEQAEVVRTVVDRLLNGSPGPAWQIVPGEGAPAPIVVVVHDASQPSEVLEQCAAALAPLENEGRIRLFVASDRDPMLVDDGVRGPLTLALERARVLVVLLTPGLLRSSGLEYALHRLRDRLVDARCVVLPIEVLPTDLEQSALASLASMSPRRVLHPRSDDPEAWREVALTVARILDGAQGSGAAASARAGFAPAFDGAGEALKRSDWDKA